MRINLVTVAVLCFVLFTAIPQQCSAQQAGPPSQPAAGRGRQELQSLIKALDLTPTQIEQIKPILKATRPQVVQINNDSNLNAEEKKAKIADLRKSEREQIEPLLTTAQMDKWRAMVKRRRQNGVEDSPNQ